MPQPFDSAVTQRTVENILEEQYWKTFLDNPFATGARTNRLIDPADLPVVGDGMNFKTRRHRGDFFRGGVDALADFETSKPFAAETIKLRWNERTPSSNDFFHLYGSGRVSVYQFDEADSDGAITDIVDEIDGGMRETFDWRLAVQRNIARTGIVGLVNGTKKNNDNPDYNSCSAYTNGATGMRCLVDTCALPHFREGALYDIYNGAALVLGGVQCEGFVNPTDTDSASAGSVGFKILSDTTGGANFDSVADNNTFYLKGSYNTGMYSLEAWLSSPTSSDSFIGAVNRSTSTNQYLVPVLLRVGDSAQTVAKTHMDQAAVALSYIHDDPDTMRAVRAGPTLIDRLRRQYDEAAYIPWPTDTENRKRFANLGSVGINYQHESLGLLTFQGDAFMTNDKIDILKLGSWRQATRGSKGLKFLKQNGSIWYRMQSAVAGGGLGMYMQCDAYANLADYNLDPKNNVRILNLSAA